MISVVAALLMTSSTASTLFDASLAAHRHLGEFTVHIEDTSRKPGKADHIQYDLAVSGASALLRIREPATSILDRSDRSFLLLKNKLVAYDAVANETLTRAVNGKQSIPIRFMGVLGSIDDSLTMALDPNTMKSFFNKFRGFTDWKTVRSGSNVTITRHGAKGTETVFRFSGAKPLLREVSITLDSNTRLHWTYVFRRGAEVNLHVPSDAMRAYAFTVRPAPPKFASAKAEQIVSRMIKAYAALKNGVIRVDGLSTLYLGGKRLREDRSGFQWTFDGSILTIRNKKTGKFFRGKSIRAVISEYIVAVGCEVDPLIRYLLAHRVPYADLFVTEANVKFKGAVSIGGTSSNIIEVDTPSRRLSLFIRTDDSLLDSVESETVDRAGRILTENPRRFTYSSIGESPSTRRFTLDTGKSKVFPLPVLDPTDPAKVKLPR